jgi:hypothetical protein
MTESEQDYLRKPPIIRDLTSPHYPQSMNGDEEFLRKEVARLSAEVEILHGHIRKGADLMVDLHDLAWRFCELLEKDVKELFDRVINLELTTFPNLQGDMDAVYRITGEGDLKRENPLDSRKPPSK